jgi:hypothetical protein
MVVFEPNTRDVLMSVIEEEKELTEIAGDFDQNLIKLQQTAEDNANNDTTLL